jgi:phosphate transport system substrate-binding protein
MVGTIMFGAGLGWSPMGNTGTQKLVLTGASTIVPLAGEIARRFESRHPGTRIDVQSGSSSRGINDVRNRTADIGMVSRDLKPEEKGLHAYAIALDGVGIIVHASNPVGRLHRRQLMDIYTGKIVNWKEVGGTNSPITVVNDAEGRSALELFLSYLNLKNSQVKSHIVIENNAQGFKTVAANRDAIGYVSIGAAAYEAGHGMPIKLLPLDGVAATVANVHNGTFPLSRPLNLVTRSFPEGLAKEFIEFARSPEVHDLVEARYFVPIGVR